MRGKIGRLWLVAAVAALGGCSTIGPDAGRIFGVWGGPHAGLSFQGGLADATFDCASGTVDDPVLPAKDGSFSVKGTYRTGTPGPIEVGEFFKSQGAVYAGHVAAPAAKGAPRVMTLNVALEDGTNLGPFTLNEGAPPQLTRCA